MSLLKELLLSPVTDEGAIPAYRKSHEIIGTAAGAQTDYQLRTELNIFSVLPSNAAGHQTTPTSDGSGQCVHPSILYFPDGWNGYKYWMVMTPYPASDASKETPEILACDDGVNWVVPAGLTNPIVTVVDVNHPNADPCLFYNEATDELWVYYQKTSGLDNYSRIYLKKSSDGINWGGTGLGTLLLDEERLTFTSPAIIKVGSTYHLWYNNASFSPNVLEHRTSSDGENWGSAETCTIHGDIPPDPVFGAQEMWHIEIKYMSDYSDYWMLLTTADVDSSTRCHLMFARSKNGIDWYLYPTRLLNPSAAGWDDTSIYKSTFLLSGATLKIWYSAYDVSALTWYIGYTTATFESTIGLRDMLPKMKSDGGDLRFTENDGLTELDYWIEQFHYGGYAVIYIKLPNIPVSPNTITIYMYYGSLDAATTESGTDVWIEFENWESYAVDDVPPLGLFLVTEIAQICKVSDNKAFKGSKSLFFDDNDATKRNALLWNHTPKLAGGFRFLLALYQDTNYGAESFSFNFMRDAQANITLQIAADRMIQEYRDGGPAWTNIGPEQTEDVWHVWEICAEIDAATWDFRFDGTWYPNITPRNALDQFQPTQVFGAGKPSKVKGNLGVCCIGKYVDPEPTHGAWGVEEVVTWPF